MDNKEPSQATRAHGPLRVADLKLVPYCSPSDEEPATPDAPRKPNPESLPERPDPIDIARTEECLTALVNRHRAHVDRQERCVIVSVLRDRIYAAAEALAAAPPRKGVPAERRKRLTELERCARDYAANKVGFECLEQRIDELELEDLFFFEDAMVLLRRAQQDPELLAEATQAALAKPENPENSNARARSPGPPEKIALKTYILRLGSVFEIGTGRPWCGAMYYDEIHDSLRGEFADLLLAAWPSCLAENPPKPAALRQFLRRLRKYDKPFKEQEERHLAELRQSVAPYVHSR